MNTSASGAVFFLGSRAHYQVLTPPSTDSNENANASSETLYDNSTFRWPSNANSQTSINTADFLINGGDKESEFPRKSKDFLYGDGVKRRLRKNKKQDGSCEKILNDNDVDSIASADVGSIGSEKSKPRPRASLGPLMSLLSRLRRGTRRSARPDPLVCTFRNTCRCDDCQSGYFKCDYDDDLYSISDDSEFSQHYAEYVQQYADSPQYECMPDCEECVANGNNSVPASPVMDYGDDDDDEDDEVFIESPPAEVSPPAAPAPRPPPAAPLDDDEEQMMMELAVGAPFLLDHFMSAPACVIM